MNDAPTHAAPYLPVRTFAEVHLWPTARTLRHWIFQDRDGFRARCTRTIGRSLVLRAAQRSKRGALPASPPPVVTA